MAERVLKSPMGAYEIIKRIGKTGTFNMYLCRTEEGKNCILKVAATVEFNPLLDREAFVLAKMRDEAERLEEEYAKVKRSLGHSEEQMLNYQLCFPNLVETFIAPAQGDRRINILGFPAVEDIRNLVPVWHLASRDRVRVDRKTSAWMTGKFLKILVFTHSLGISNKVTGDNILIERDEHYVLMFDFTSMAIHSESIPKDVAREEISRGAMVMIGALGGDPWRGKLPEDREQDPDGRYAEHLYALSLGSEDDARQAHERFYSLVRSLWPRAYWPFTTYDL